MRKRASSSTFHYTINRFILLFSSFYVQSPVDHLPLHSFPTRRSSDLSEMALYFIGGILKHAPATCAFTNPTTNSDRKSTRLNSSHRCISYAVFCLKKKIIEFVATRFNSV